MADRVTVVSNQSWFSRLGGAVKGVFFGLILFIVAFPLLFWNEGRTVKRYKTLEEGSGSVISIEAEQVNSENEGKLVHLTGKAETEAILRDPVFDVSANALRFRRSVEMYQWVEKSQSETRTKLGGGEETVTTYTYSKEWSSSAINSSRFQEPTGHQNPGSFPYEALERTADNVSFGAFTLSESLVKMISNFEPLPVTGEAEPAQAGGTTAATDPAAPASVPGTAATPAPVAPAPPPAPAAQPAPGQPTAPIRQHIFGGGYYIGTTPTAPEIGDMRIKFAIVKPQEISLVAQQAGNSFSSYTTKAGGTILLLQAGAHSAEAMFEQAHKDNKMIMWLLRLAGFVVMLAGLNMMFKPLSVVADVLPLAGRLVGAGTGIIAFLLAATFSLLTIAIAWIFYRPVLGIILLVAVGILTFLIIKKMKAAKAEKAANAAKQAV